MLLLAPFIFMAHVLEEAPGFVEWANAHIARDITAEDFWRINSFGLFITAAVVAVEWFARSGFSLMIALAWFSFLMLANAILHIVGSLVDEGYVPGVLTAACLYLPYYFWLITQIIKSGRIKNTTLAGAAVLGAIPMLVHGYLILFRGSRLF